MGPVTMLIGVNENVTMAIAPFVSLSRQMSLHLIPSKAVASTSQSLGPAISHGNSLCFTLFGISETLVTVWQLRKDVLY